MLAVLLFLGCASAQSYEFAGVMWNQENTPDVYAPLPVSTVEGAIINSEPVFGTSAGLDTFPEPPLAGFDPLLSLGHQSGTTSTTTNRIAMVNLPAGNDGANARSGFEMSWTGDRGLSNGVGADFVMYESASNSVSDEAYGVQVFDVSKNAWSIWYNLATFTFANYNLQTTIGLMAYEIDLSELGVGPNDLISAIRVINLTQRDTFSTSPPSYVVSGRQVLVEDLTGADFSAEYAATALDPDPLYIAVLATARMESLLIISE